MSAWRHLLCIMCWNTRHPEQRTQTLDRLEGPPCCACGASTSSGIYVRAHPTDFKCWGGGAVHDGDPQCKHGIAQEAYCPGCSLEGIESERRRS
jgi:hypothetical protein